jgi:hypothetical protein
MKVKVMLTVEVMEKTSGPRELHEEGTSQVPVNFL